MRFRSDMAPTPGHTVDDRDHHDRYDQHLQESQEDVGDKCEGCNPQSPRASGGHGDRHGLGPLEGVLPRWSRVGQEPDHLTIRGDVQHLGLELLCGRQQDLGLVVGSPV